MRSPAVAVVAIVLVTAAAAQTSAPSSPAVTPAQAGVQAAQPATVPPAMAPGSSEAAALTAADKKFAQNAAQAGMAEVQMGQLAAQKAADPKVKQFADTMVADHSKANDKLKRIASSKGLMLPSDIPSSERREQDKLSKLSGAAFDREYMKHQVAGHRKVVSEFKAAGKSVRDPDLKQFAQETLPTVEHHLEMAKATKPQS